MTQRTYVCKECINTVSFDLREITEEEWKEFQSIGPSFQDPEKLLEKSFVFINEEMRALENEHKEKNMSLSPNVTPSLSSPSSSLLNSQLSSEGKEKFHANAFKTDINVLNKLIDIASKETKLDHPLCSTCTQKLLKQLNDQLDELNSEKRTYTDYISQCEKELKNTNLNPVTSNNPARSPSSSSSLNKVDEETKLLQTQLNKLKSEKEILLKELNNLEEESRKIDNYEEMFFRDANDFYYNIEILSHQHQGIKQKIREISNHLELMKRTNVFDDAFHIYYDGHFGTINGLRLGRLPSINVEWEEINAGLGQALLLLDVLTQRCKHFQFKGYELHPMGSFSFIREKKKDNKSYMDHSMYGSTNLFGYKQCDRALECFLLCISQFADWIRKEDANFSLGYEIKQHEIGDAKTKKYYSIRFAQHSEENWTQALKYMIIDLKYLLAWVARFTS